MSSNYTLYPWAIALNNGIFTLTVSNRSITFSAYDYITIPIRFSTTLFSIGKDKNSLTVLHCGLSTTFPGLTSYNEVLTSLSDLIASRNLVITNSSSNEVFRILSTGGATTTGPVTSANLTTSGNLTLTSANGIITYGSAWGLSDNKQLALYDSLSNQYQFYGFGANVNNLRYHVPTSSANHTFYSGVNGTSALEIFRILGSGGATTTGNIAAANFTATTKISTPTIFIGNAANNGSTFTYNAGGGDNSGVLFIQASKPSVGYTPTCFQVAQAGSPSLSNVIICSQAASITRSVYSTAFAAGAYLYVDGPTNITGALTLTNSLSITGATTANAMTISGDLAHTGSSFRANGGIIFGDIATSTNTLLKVNEVYSGTVPAAFIPGGATLSAVNVSITRVGASVTIILPPFTSSNSVLGITCVSYGPFPPRFVGAGSTCCVSIPRIAYMGTFVTGNAVIAPTGAPNYIYVYFNDARSNGTTMGTLGLSEKVAINFQYIE